LCQDVISRFILPLVVFVLYKTTFMCCIIGEVKHVQLGASTVLTCRSVFYDSVLWYYSELDSEKSHILYWDDIFTKDPLRFEVLRPNSSRGVFDLSIRNVQLSDSGMYRCTEHSGQHPGEVRYILNVTGQWILLHISYKFSTFVHCSLSFFYLHGLLSPV